MARLTPSQQRDALLLIENNPTMRLGAIAERVGTSLELVSLFLFGGGITSYGPPAGPDVGPAVPPAQPEPDAATEPTAMSNIASNVQTPASGPSNVANTAEPADDVLSELRKLMAGG